MPDEELKNEQQPGDTGEQQQGEEQTGKEPETKEKDVKVKASVLQKILEGSERMEKLLEESQKKIAILEQSVSQNKPQAAQDAAKPKALPQVFFKVYDAKIVTGWKSEKAEYIYNPLTGNVSGEVLKEKLFYQDGSESPVLDQVVLTRIEDRVFARIEGQEGDYLTVRAEKLESSNQDLLAGFALPQEPFKVHKNFINHQ